MNHVLRPDLVTPARAHRAAPWTRRVLALLPEDASSFGGTVRIRHDGLFAQHRTGAGDALGWEAVVPGANERPLVRYTRGAARGLVHEAPRSGAPRLLLVEGALAALAARALAGEAERGLLVCGLGGVWTAAAADHVATLCRRTGVAEVLVANSTHHAAGQALRVEALADLHALGLSVVERAGPPGGWAAALRDLRGAEDVR
ncbi:hypothetical protein ACFQX4_00200 [Roseomonas sp. GCM10028921]